MKVKGKEIQGEKEFVVRMYLDTATKKFTLSDRMRMEVYKGQGRWRTALKSDYELLAVQGLERK